MRQTGTSGKNAYLVAILVAVFLLYTPSWIGKFVSWGDGRGIVANPAVQGFSLENLKILFSPAHSVHLERNAEYLPLRDLSHMADYVFWGLNPVGYHLGNSLVFLAGLTALFFVLKRCMPRGRGAHAALLLFAFHPLHVEAIAWISSRKYLLAFFFFFLSLLLFQRYGRARGFRWYLGSLGAFAAALLSHPFAGVLPLFLLLLLFLSGGAGRRGLRTMLAGLPAVVPFFAAAGLSWLLVLHLQAAARVSFPVLSATFLGRAFVAAELAWKMVARYFFPFELCTLYPEGAGDPFSPARTFALAGLMLGFLLGVLLLVRARSTGFFLLAFLFSLTPFFGFVPLSQYAADRYLLIPGAVFIPFVVLLFLAVLNRGAGGRRAALLEWGARLLCCIAAAALGLLALQRQKIWKDDSVFWRDTARKAPYHASVQYQMGIVYWGEGRGEEALACFEKAKALDPRFVMASCLAAELLCHLGEPLRAKQLMKEALQSDPDSRELLLYYAYTLIEAESFTDAEAILERFHTEDPQDSLILLFLGRLYLRWGDNARGLEMTEQALEKGLLDMQKKNAIETLAKEYEKLGEWELARMYFEIWMHLENIPGRREWIRMKAAQMETRMRAEEQK